MILVRGSVDNTMQVVRAIEPFLEAPIATA